MIKILIQRVESVTYKVKENLLTKKTPTAQTKPKQYSSGDEVVYAEEYAVVESEKTRDVTTKLLEQEIGVAAEGKFSLENVIRAINGMQ